MGEKGYSKMKAAVIAANILHSHRVVDRDLHAYLVGGSTALRAELGRRKIAPRSISRAVGAVSRRMRELGLSDGHDADAVSRVALRRAVADILVGHVGKLLNTPNDPPSEGIMTTTLRIYWDTSDPRNHGWAYRLLVGPSNAEPYVVELESGALECVDEYASYETLLSDPLLPNADQIEVVI